MMTESIDQPVTIYIPATADLIAKREVDYDIAGAPSRGQFMPNDGIIPNEI
jgi:hypothetical protein